MRIRKMLAIGIMVIVLMMSTTQFDGYRSYADASALSPIGDLTSITDNDDSSIELPLTDVFSNGINFEGTNYQTLYISTNGYITLGHGNSSYSPEGITKYTLGPIVAAQYDDIHVGTNGDIYYYQNAAEGYVLVTYDQVAPFGTPTGVGSGYNSFQILLRRLGDIGSTDFQIEIRYNALNWAKSSNNSAWPTAGWSAGDQVTYAELPESGTSDFLSLANGANIGETGVYRWDVTGGVVQSTPTVNETDTVSSITNMSAVSGGNISSDGGLEVTVRGVAYSTAHTPTISDNHVASGSGTGTFTATMEGLNLSTRYYVRAYATNSMGTGYGPEKYFTTLSTSSPTVSTVDVSSVTTDSAFSGGDITSDGGAAITEKGIVYGTAINPTISGSKVIGGSGTDSFSLKLTGLTTNTQYHARAYAINSIGTSYGENIDFYTLAKVSQITAATINGDNAELTIDANLNPENTQYKIEASTSANDFSGAVIASDWTVLSGGKITFDQGNLPDRDTNYYFRIIAKNGDDVFTDYDVNDPSSSPAAVYVLTLPEAPNAPTLEVTGISEITISGFGVEKVDSAEITYNIFRDNEVIAAGVTASSFVDSGNYLNANESYTYKVEAVNASGAGNESDSAARYTLADEVGRAILKSKTDSSITLKLDKGNNANMPEYRIVAKESDNSENTIEGSWSASSNMTLTGLAPDKDYYLYVSTRNLDQVESDSTKEIRILEELREIDSGSVDCSEVTIFSDNDIDNAQATADDRITVEFVADEYFDLANDNITATIAGEAANVSFEGDLDIADYSYKAIRTMTSSDDEGEVAISIIFSNEDGKQTNVTETTDGSSVIFDDTDPVLTIDGNPVAWTSGSAFLAWSATDNQDVDYVTLPDGATSSALTGEYTAESNGDFTFTAYDLAGNTDSQIVGVEKIDKIAPIVDIADYEEGWTNQNIIVTANDSANDGLSDVSFNANSHEFTTNGSFTFTATDAVGNTDSETVTITNIDKIDPVISIIGDNPYRIDLDETFDDPGATSSDAASGVDGEISTQSTLKTSRLGSYRVTYTVSDNAGNEVEATRNVEVVNSIAVSWISLEGVGSSAASAKGSIDSLGGAGDIIRYGLVWSSENSEPTLADSYNELTELDAPGEFTCTARNLSSSTNYYIRVYAEDSTGVQYSGTHTFKTDKKPVTSITLSANPETNEPEINEEGREVYDFTKNTSVPEVTSILNGDWIAGQLEGNGEVGEGDELAALLDFGTAFHSISLPIAELAPEQNNDMGEGDDETPEELESCEITVREETSAKVNRLISDVPDEQKEGRKVVSPVVTYEVTAQMSDGSTEKIDTFDSYVERKLTVKNAENLNSANLIAVRLDESTGEYIPVPASFEKAEDGTLLATIFDNQTGSYAVIENNRDYASDLPEGHWAADTAIKMSKKLMLEEVFDEGSNLDAGITRAEMSGVLLKVLGINKNIVVSDAVYDDLPEGSKWHKTGLVAVEAGILNGYGDGSIKPEQVISREEMAVVIYRTMDRMIEMAEARDKVIYEDHEAIKDWAVGQVNALTDIEIFKGYESGEFIPDGDIKVGEALTALYRMSKYLGFID